MNIFKLIVPVALYKNLYSKLYPNKAVPKEFQKKNLSDEEQDALQDYQDDNS